MTGNEQISNGEPEMLNIGGAATASGMSAKMIRYYEQSGLVPPPRRTEAGSRLYSANEIAALRFIRRAREYGFSAKRIAFLLGLWRDKAGASSSVRQIALDQVAQLQRQIAELTVTSDALQRLADDCDGESRSNCPILGDFDGTAGQQEDANREPSDTRENLAAPQDKLRSRLLFGPPS